MPQGTVLLISNTGDVHCDYLVDACKRQGIECFRLNTDRFRKTGFVNWRIDADQGMIGIGERQCAISDFGLVVFRRPVPLHQTRKDLQPWVGRVLDAEWGAIEAGLSVAARCLVVNTLAGSAVAQNKPAQLHVAKAAALRVPETLISTDADALNRFARQFPCVTKGIVNAFAVHGTLLRSAFTSHVDIDRLKDFEAEGNPVLLQRAIKPHAVWRIVVVGVTTFGFRFHGDALRTVADSRQVEDILDGAPQPVPKAVEQGLQAMCKTMAISFASTDFIEDEYGHLWFVDLNPEGQWAFLEEKFSVRISDAIVTLRDRTS